MYISQLLLLLFATSVLAKVISQKPSYACKYNPKPILANGCSVDLTVAMDMSSAMGSDAHIATLADTYGALSIGASNYFNNYADICQYIHSAQEQAIQLGLGSAKLSEVFETYQISLQNSGRNYKKVLVLLTSVTDAKDIQVAKHVSDLLHASGVIVIVGALGNASSSQLSQLGEYVLELPRFTVSAVANITEDICQYGGITVKPHTTTVNQKGSSSTTAVTKTPSTTPLSLSTTEQPSTTKIPVPPTTTKIPLLPSTTKSPLPSPTSNPTNPGIGTQCSTNVKNAWLDIVFLFDVSDAITDIQMNDLVEQTMSYMRNFTLGSAEPHSTRVALIKYASTATIAYSLDDIQNHATFNDALLTLKNRTKPLDFVVDVQNALQVAYKHLQSHTTYRQQIILLTSGAYQQKGFKGANHTAAQIKANEMTIFTVNFKASDGVLNENLNALASPGYAYTTDDKEVYRHLPLGMTQVNCFCPGSTEQFYTLFKNATATRYTKYADCISGYAGETYPSIVSKYGCNSGILASITSQEKLDFIINNTLEHELFGQKAFTVGGHKVGTEWVWSGYNGTSLPFGSIPPFTEVSPTDTYSFFDFLPGGNGFAFKSTADIPRPYVCQTRACDADFICDQSVKRKLFQKS
uniref:VWFA domain-containing protein n=1 Tax=Panagrolaimus davidi TaxID=227884 RepID=A0A914RE86_9BILA